MAQWNRDDRTLHAKVVYYGPAFGGKTTNLEALHRLTDLRGESRLLSIDTAEDRTLFFDLLSVDLGELLGYRVGVKVYAVPGQVRYETTRKVVLSGADAVVFVADSSPRREEQNRWSMQNLEMNMRANGLDPARVPILYQYNKQDLEQAAPPDEVARWLGLGAKSEGFPAVATDHRGVLETFVAACKAMLESLVEHAEPATRKQIDTKQLTSQVDRAFAPHLARASSIATDATIGREAVVGGDEELLEGSLQAGAELGERLAHESGRAQRLERELEALRALGDSVRRVGASFDRDTVVDAGLESARKTLGVGIVSLLHRGKDGRLETVRVCGSKREPLLASDQGKRLAHRLCAGDRPCVVNELSEEYVGKVQGVSALACVPLEATPHFLIAYVPSRGTLFDESDVRILTTLAAHLAVGLERVRLYAELEAASEAVSV